ncbi:MAG: dihydroorotate dehydrogenase electron transfer subunit [Nitrospirae bacterium]|nr:dihydroorotate dehydrogenase electron transfer subunit [Nitrospirota bacterium]
MQATVTSNENIFGSYFHLEVAAKGIGRKAWPGTFYMLKVASGTDPLLRRPISLHRVVSDDVVRFLYKSVGRGTNILGRLVPGDSLDIIGPLGNGFKVGKSVRLAMLVAGGIGVAPLLGLAEHIMKTRKDVTVVAFIGGRSEEDLLAIQEFRELGVRMYLCTEDGSLARCGIVTDTIEEYIKRYAPSGTKGWEMFSCGPKGMLRGVDAIASMHKIKHHASLEANMACGVGACMGCVVSILDRKTGVPVYKKVCDDGPVFDAEDVVW